MKICQLIQEILVGKDTVATEKTKYMAVYRH